MPQSTKKLQEAIREENLDGWLFFNFQHRDSISDRILEIRRDTLNTRPWYFIALADGKAYKVIHAIEANILDHLDGTSFLYSSREQLIKVFNESISLRGKRIAAQFSPSLPVLSYIDHGTARFFENLGVTLISSAPLIQRAIGLLSKKQIESHEAAARELYKIVETVWGKVQTGFAQGQKIRDVDAQQWISAEIEQRDLFTFHPPVVASGKNSSNPHFSPEGEGTLLHRGDVVQFDLWAKKKTEDAVYADISWVGILSDQAPERIQKVFDAIISARDRGIAFIKERFARNEPVKGYEVDDEVRHVLIRRGYAEYIKHRTGHGIDTELHGCGVNLDTIEFKDERQLLNGACFSIEPGLYLEDFGVRTEIDAYIENRKLFVSGGQPQYGFLTLK